MHTINKYISLIYILIVCLPIGLRAQSISSGEEIKILHADYTFIEMNTGSELKILYGQVQLFHDSSFLYCDSARIDGLRVMAYGHVVIRQNDTVQIFADSLRYDGRLKSTDLYGEVILVNGNQSLYTKKLHYDLETSVASYSTPATLKSKSTVLKSQRGIYLVNENMARFAGQVQMSDPEIQLKSDSLLFNTKTQTAFFVAPTIIEKKDRKIYCEGGYYDVDDEKAEFTGNPQFQEQDRKASSEIMKYDGRLHEIILLNKVKYLSNKDRLEGDSLYYDENTRLMTLLGKGSITTSNGTIQSSNKLIYNDSLNVFTTFGRALLQDSTNQLEADHILKEDKTGNLIASGRVHWVDTTNDASIDCDSMHLDKSSNRVTAVGAGRQPLFKSFHNTFDTLFLKADTLVAYQADTNSKAKSILAFHKVSVFRSDLQARCDSLTYNERDSLFTLYREPVIWSDTSQFFADTIRLLQSGNQIKSLFLNQNAMIINSPDLKYFNQIKGRKVRADFDSSNLAVVDVIGNAEAVYYILDDQRAYIGVNKIICSQILVRFGNNQIDRIYFYTAPNGTMHPMLRTNHEALKLKGFKWLNSERPTYLEMTGESLTNVEN